MPPPTSISDLSRGVPRTAGRAPYDGLVALRISQRTLIKVSEVFLGIASYHKHGIVVCCSVDVYPTSESITFVVSVAQMKH